MIREGEVIRILLVEDSCADAGLAQWEIKRAVPACVFQQVETREDFLSALTDFVPDLIISDYRMPSFDGLAALRLTLERAPLTPLIIITGAMNEDTAVECMRAGAVDYVIKEHLKRLGQAVLHALEEKQVRYERYRAEEALRESEERYRTLIHTLPDAVLVVDPLGNLTYCSPAALKLFGYTQDEYLLGLNLMSWVEECDRARAVRSLGDTLTSGSIKSEEYRLRKKDGSNFYGEVSGTCVRNGNGLAIEIITIVRDISERKRVEMNLLASEARYRSRTEALEALFQVSASLRKAQTAQEMYPLLIHEIQQALKTDLVSLIQPDEQDNLFKVTLSVGSIPVEPGLTFNINQGLCSRVLHERKLCATENYCAESNQIPHFPGLEQLGPAVFVPLLSEDHILGILMAGRKSGPERKPFLPEETRLLTAMGEMAGNALRRVRLFEELMQAYDATIEGLTRALDLRDKETEGHTRRVIDLTVRLAKAVGIAEADLIHIRRGAYLHDMGKIGVPDTILHKQNQLSASEWEIMRRHPQYAYDMLYPIEYLRPALEIPYCHHERWDGTGYPQGLKGEAIPLAARIFAVVDVWDAITNERAYRKAWPREQAIEHIQRQSGKHFDPAIVKAFLEIISALE